MTRKKKNLPAKRIDAKMVNWKKWVPRSVFPLEKGSKAGVVMDGKGTPRWFIFDTFALLDVLSKIDGRLVDTLSPQDYHSKKVNPAGWLIDEIESKLPLSDSFVQSLNEAIDEAEKHGWISMEEMKKRLQIE